MVASSLLSDHGAVAVGLCDVRVLRAARGEGEAGPLAANGLPHPRPADGTSARSGSLRSWCRMKVPRLCPAESSRPITARQISHSRTDRGAILSRQTRNDSERLDNAARVMSTYNVPEKQRPRYPERKRSHWQVRADIQHVVMSMKT